MHNRQSVSNRRLRQWGDPRLPSKEFQGLEIHHDGLPSSPLPLVLAVYSFDAAILIFPLFPRGHCAALWFS